MTEQPRLDRLTALLHGLAPQVALAPGAPGALHGLSANPEDPPALRLLLLLEGVCTLAASPQAPMQAPVQALVQGPALLVWRGDLPAAQWPSPSAPSATLQGQAALPGPMADLLLSAFDGVLALPLVSADPALQQAVQLIGTELQAPRCGGPLLLDRAGDILFIGLLRHLIAQPRTRHGLLNGLSDPRLARALVGAHSQPNKAWTLERLAGEAGMSRTAFATRFRAVMGQTPGEYLFRMRMALARDGLQRGQGLKQAAAAVGYTPTSLSRAMARQR